MGNCSAKQSEEQKDVSLAGRKVLMSDFLSAPSWVYVRAKLKELSLD